MKRHALFIVFFNAIILTLCLVEANAQDTSPALPAITASNTAMPAVRIARFSGDRPAAISYTFDDNLCDQFTLAVPMLNDVGFKGTFFVIAGKTPETAVPEPNQKNPPRNISWAELKEMSNQGHEIANHSWSHAKFTTLPLAELETELSKAYEAINAHIGKPPLTLAFPGNASNPEVRTACLKYQVALRTYQDGIGGKSTIESLNTWTDSLIAGKKWGIAMLHAIVQGYDQLTDPEILRAHLKYVKTREADIWVDTFANVARYERERDIVKLQITGSDGKLTCIVKSALDPQRYDVPLTLVFAVPGVTSARAKRAGQKLPVRIGKEAIYVDAAPGTQPIVMKWK
jgi:peptidoglycan/xylan/chitin deacetylase (PgdA/CDA1 family)